MRMYQPAWNRLKQNPNEPLVISAHGKLHKRIYKAIKKEKNLDNVFSLLLDDEGKRAVLSSKSEGNALKISLEIKYKLEGLF